MSKVRLRFGNVGHGKFNFSPFPHVCTAFHQHLMTVQDGLTQLVAAAGSVTGRHYEEAGKSRDSRILVEGVLKNAPSCTAKQSY